MPSTNTQSNEIETPQWMIYEPVTVNPGVALSPGATTARSRPPRGSRNPGGSYLYQAVQNYSLNNLGVDINSFYGGETENKISGYRAKLLEFAKDIPALEKLHPYLESDIQYHNTEIVADLGGGRYVVIHYGSYNSYETFVSGLRLAYGKIKDNIWKTHSSTILKDSGLYTFFSTEEYELPVSIRDAIVFSGNISDIKSPIVDKFSRYGKTYFYNPSEIILIDEIVFKVVYDGVIFEKSLPLSWGGTENHLSAIENVNSVLRDSVSREIQLYQRSTQINQRRPSTSSNKYISPKAMGEYVDGRVAFAVELECYGKNQKVTGEMSNKIAPEWGVSKDGSLTSDIGYPIEIQSPILMGKKGEQLIIDTCNTLNDMGFRVDETCGMHLHMDGGTSFVRNQSIQMGKEKPVNLISLYLFHRLFEDVVVSFLPTTRRVNHYCSQFKRGAEYQGASISFNSIDESFTLMKSMKTLRDFEMYWYKARNTKEIDMLKGQRYTVSRYMGVNFHSLLKDNHIEIRYHSGTTNYEKILYWCDLHCKIIQLCASGVINYKMLEEIKDKKLNLEDLTKEMFKILQLKEDTVEYLMGRKETFKDADKKKVDEILIDKTKKVNFA